MTTILTCGPSRPPRAPRSSTRERYDSHRGGMTNGVDKDSSGYKRRSRSMESFGGFNNVNTR